jgi:hypothetical protein
MILYGRVQKACTNLNSFTNEFGYKVELSFAREQSDFSGVPVLISRRASVGQVKFDFLLVEIVTHHLNAIAFLMYFILALQFEFEMLLVEFAGKNISVNFFPTRNFAG